MGKSTINGHFQLLCLFTRGYTWWIDDQSLDLEKGLPWNNPLSECLDCFDCKCFCVFFLTHGKVTPSIHDKWVCLKIGYIPNYSHLIGIMISKTIGFRGTLFSDKPKCVFFFFSEVNTMVNHGIPRWPSQLRLRNWRLAVGEKMTR